MKQSNQHSRSDGSFSQCWWCLYFPRSTPKQCRFLEKLGMHNSNRLGYDQAQFWCGISPTWWPHLRRWWGRFFSDRYDHTSWYAIVPGLPRSADGRGWSSKKFVRGAEERPPHPPNSTEQTFEFNKFIKSLGGGPAFNGVGRWLSFHFYPVPPLLRLGRGSLWGSW